MRRLTCVIGTFLVLGFCTVSFADEIPALELICWTEGSTPVWWYPEGQSNGNGSYTYSGQYSDPDGHWAMNYNVLADADPFVNAVYGLTNLSGVTQNFTLIVNLPIAPPIVPSSLMGGSTGGSLTDANYDGVGTLATVGPGTAFYDGQIDGANVLPIYSDPFSVSVPFQGGTVTIPAVNVGLPGPTIPGPAALTDIGIMHKFSLTAGDTVGLTSFFVVTPEPTSLMLLGLGVAALVRRR